MKIGDIFKVVTTPDGHQWRMRLKTTDAARSRDLRLTPEVAPMNPQMMGRRWAGEFEHELVTTLSAADAAKARKAFVDGLGPYDNGQASGTMRVNPAGVLATDLRPEKEFTLSATADEMNRANRARYGQPSLDVGSRPSGPITPDEQNAINKDFWAKRTAVPQPFNKKWGQG